jgi:hypothetical protein
VDASFTQAANARHQHAGVDICLANQIADALEQQVSL